MSRTAIAILSTENLHHNLQGIQDKVKPAKIIAMVKANAYGHGLRSVSLRLDKHVAMLGVASIDEAIALRKSGVKCDILLAEGVFEATELMVASTEKCQVVFHHASQIEWLQKSLGPLPLQAWLKVNTGMGRLGFSLKDAKSAYKQLCESPLIAKPVRLMSHFACADEPEHPLNAEQIKAFQTLIQDLNIQHETHYAFCNSAAIFAFKECYYDYVRPGIALYGISPLKGVSAETLNLKPVMTLQSSLISIQNMPKGASIGYGARYQCPESMPVGVVAFGYGDGYPVSAKDGTPLLVNGLECPLVGRVSMDMLMVDLRPCTHAKVGDPVILWGEGLPIERVVEHTSNITWDLLTGVQHRVKFLWTPIA